MLIEEPPGYPWRQPWRGRERAAPPTAYPSIGRKLCCVLTPPSCSCKRSRGDRKKWREHATSRHTTPGRAAFHGTCSVGFAKGRLLNVQMLRRGRCGTMHAAVGVHGGG